MTGLVRKTSLMLAACGLLVAGVASANVPDPTQSVIPSVIYLVGNSGGVVDAANGAFSVTVKDLSGALINNSNVVVDFSACTDSKLGNAQADATLSLDCTAKTVRKFTVAGVVTMTIQGIGNISNTTNGATLGCARVYADGVLLGRAQVALYDHLGGGVAAGDLAAWLSDFFSLQNPSRSDYLTPFNNVSAADLSKWQSVFFSLGSTSNALACP